MNYPRLVLAAVAALIAFFVWGFLTEGWIIANKDMDNLDIETPLLSFYLWAAPLSDESRFGNTQARANILN